MFNIKVFTLLACNRNSIMLVVNHLMARVHIVIKIHILSATIKQVVIEIKRKFHQKHIEKIHILIYNDVA